MELIFDVKKIGNRIYEARRKCRLTQAQVAEAAELSDRAYADIERGSVNMRLLSLLRICSVLKIDPNSLLSESKNLDSDADDVSVINMLNDCSTKEKKTALKLVSVYINSLKSD